MTKTSSNVKGILFLLLAMLIISLQSIAVKGLGGSYPVLEMVVLRNLIALPFTLLFFRFEGKQGLPTTKQFKLEFTRGIFLFLSYTTFMMGLAALPLAEVEAIRFSGTIHCLTFFYQFDQCFTLRADLLIQPRRRDDRHPMIQFISRVGSKRQIMM